MVIVITLLVFAATTALLWFHGLWSNVVVLVNLLAAILMTFCLTPAVAYVIQKEELVEPGDAINRFLPLVVFTLLFAFSYSLLRLATDGLSRRRVRFPPLFETIGRSVMAAVNGFLFIALVCGMIEIARSTIVPSISSKPTFLGIPAGNLIQKLVTTASDGSLEP